MHRPTTVPYMHFQRIESVTIFQIRIPIEMILWVQQTRAIARMTPVLVLLLLPGTVLFDRISTNLAKFSKTHLFCQIGPHHRYAVRRAKMTFWLNSEIEYCIFQKGFSFLEMKLVSLVKSLQSRNQKFAGWAHSHHTDAQHWATG